MANFRMVSNTVKAVETKEEIKEVVKKGRPVGSKNKVKAVTMANDTHIDMGVYGRFNTSDIELMSGSKFRVFASGNVGLTNARFRVKVGDEWLVFGPCNASFLTERDDQWRKDNASTNNRSGLKVSELDGYELDDDGESNIQDLLGEKKIKEA